MDTRSNYNSGGSHCKTKIITRSSTALQYVMVNPLAVCMVHQNNYKISFVTRLCGAKNKELMKGKQVNIKSNRSRLLMNVFKDSLEFMRTCFKLTKKQVSWAPFQEQMGR